MKKKNMRTVKKTRTIKKFPKEAVDETYEEVRRLVYSTAIKFAKQYGWDIDETIAEALLHYSGAYHCYDPIRFKMSFSSFVRRCIWVSLLESLEKKCRRGNRVTVVDFTEIDAPDKHSFNLVDFLDSLSANAKMVAKMVLDTPRQIAALVEDGGGTPQVFKRVIKDYLFALGWSKQDVDETFEEIREVLDDD